MLVEPQGGLKTQANTVYVNSYILNNGIICKSAALHQDLFIAMDNHLDYGLHMYINYK